MDTLTFGFTLTIVGMGGTILSLYLLSMVMDLLKLIFPYRDEDEKEAK